MHIYVGTFLLALVMLALEIAETRLLSVATWYHLAFFAVSTAMLGMTVGATIVYLNPKRFSSERLQENLGKACFGFAAVVPVSLILLCMIPLTQNVSVMSVFGLAAMTAACALPFFYAGIAITLVLTKSSLPVGLIYASDLLGAAMGCMLVLGGLELLDGPSLVLLCGALGAIAGAIYVWNAPTSRFRRLNVAMAVILGLLTVVNAQSSRMIRPLLVKGQIISATSFDIERWNSFSRICVMPLTDSEPFLWGASPTLPRQTILHRQLSIDGAAGTHVEQFRSNADIEHLRYDVTNVVHALRPHGPAAVIGVGGGRDIQSGLLFGHEHVLGVDVNPIFIELLQNEFRDFANIANRDDVTLVVDEARSYLSRSDESFATLQMSLIDTFAATGAGAMTMTENALYTVEAWSVFLDRLADDGIFTVSRWFDRNELGETGRLLSVAAMSLLDRGITNPQDHIALVAQGSVATLLVGKQPLTTADLDALQSFCEKMEHTILASPTHPAEHPILKALLAARSPDELYASVKDAPFNFDPSTDEDPYFFNMLRLSDVTHPFAKPVAGRLSARKRSMGVASGNMIATMTLVGLIVVLTVMCVGTIVVPLILRGRVGEASVSTAGVVWEGAIYFSLIGAGFMLLEVAMMQRLSVFLGHPVYALGVLLFAIILSAGLGSLLSERLPLTRAPWIFIYPLAACLVILVTRYTLIALTVNFVTSPMATKIALAIAVIFPVGLFLGLCFPAGMRLVRTVHPEETPWYWALNGIFGVLASAVAIFVSIFMGISVNFYLAAACYALVFACNIKLLHRRRGIVDAAQAT